MIHLLWVETDDEDVTDMHGSVREVRRTHGVVGRCASVTWVTRDFVDRYECVI